MSIGKLIVTLLLGLVCAGTASARDRPNIVLIVMDDLGYSDLGAYGGEIETPNIDELARLGVRFSNFHTASSCAPTRAMLLTGVDHHLAGIGNMAESMPLSHRGEPGYLGALNERVTTVASILQSSGYRTSIAGKWHLGHDSMNLPPARGFDYSVIQADSGADNFEMRPYLPMTPEVRWYENGQRMRSLPEGFYSSTYFVDKTIDFLASAPAGQPPFFAYVAFQANHTPLQAPVEFIDRYRGRYSEGWHAVGEMRVQRLRETGLLAEDAKLAGIPSEEAWQSLTQERRYYEARRMQAYAGMATAMDHEVGRLVDYLRASRQLHNTVFVVLSDNGASTAEPYESTFGRLWLERHFHHEVERLGERGSWVAAGRGWGRVSNIPLSGAKFSASEGGTRVPLIIAGAAQGIPGLLRHDFTYVTDIAPTLLDLAQVEPASLTAGRLPMSGRSLRSLLTDESLPGDAGDTATGFEFAGHAALYRGNYKIVKNRPPVGDGEWRLFQIIADPGETQDLGPAMPDLLRAMRADYAAYVKQVGVLEVPHDYVLQKQAMINVLLFFYLPRYLPWLVGLLVLLAVATTYLWRRRSRV